MLIQMVSSVTTLAKTSHWIQVRYCLTWVSPEIGHYPNIFWTGVSDLTPDRRPKVVTRIGGNCEISNGAALISEEFFEKNGAQIRAPKANPLFGSGFAAARAQLQKKRYISVPMVLCWWHSMVLCCWHSMVLCWWHSMVFEQ